MSEFIKIKFAKGVSFEEVNPDDVALKCPYMNNLCATSMQILPHLNEVVDDIVVTKGFIGKARLNSEYKGSKVPSELIKHTQGLALRLTWRNYNKSYAIKVLKNIFNNLQNGFKIIIKDYDIYFCQEPGNKVVFEEYVQDNKTNLRTVKK